MVSENTTALIQRWLDRHQAGDPSAREHLIRHCQDRVRIIVRRMLRRFPNVRRWEQTSDVFQNVLVRLDRSLRQVPLTTAWDFLRLAAFHVRLELIDLARYHRRDQEQDPRAPEPVADFADPVALARWGELHEHLAKQPEEVRGLFDLLYYQGLTQPEAALLLGVSLRTLKRRWQAARLDLMEWLGDDLSL